MPGARCSSTVTNDPLPRPEPRTLRLRDGRALGFAEYGDPRGRPLVFFHGFPGSRLDGALVEGEARAARIRLIAPDRPGMGGSSARPGRGLLDWASDVSELADALALERFPIVGVSGGGPFALACARAIPERLSAIGIACGMGPSDDPELLRGMLVWNRLGLRAARVAPWLARPVMTAVRPLALTAPRLLVGRLARTLPEPDASVFRDERLRALLAASFREAFRSGARGPADDGRIYARPWGFALGEVEARVHLWHGERDHVVPVTLGRRVARELPRCDARFSAEDGHFSLVLRRCREVLETLCS